MTSLERKIELANEMMKKVPPVHRTFYGVTVYGHVILYECNDDGYLDMIHGRND